MNPVVARTSSPSTWPRVAGRMRPMSLYYEVVFTCFLRDNTPGTVLDALRWHLGMSLGRPSGLGTDEHMYPVLTPDPESRLPGGDFASFQRQCRGFATGHKLYAWGLFSRNYWLDDEIGELVTILDLLAPYVEEPGYGGYFREECDSEPTVIIFQNGTYGPLKL